MTTRQATGKRIVQATATLTLAFFLTFGGSAALGANGPSVQVSQDETTYQITGDECVGSVCVEGVKVTTPRVGPNED